MILSIRSDRPVAEVGLFFKAGQERQYEKWQAHRELAETIHLKISTLLKAENKNWQDITGVVCYKGPGSFTGLRIGATVANSLAYSLDIPAVGTTGDDWISKGIKQLPKNADEQIVVPEYGRPARITEPKK
ncbi:tRNA (adenosine(37)-N6)-threonylcarbamoyltransferase complex dimerization subunit type 1 TsaB [Candidatus Saccharibacteria bacterium]|nr:tRNA (adenosine(37)-N6)-threonylcarbamoyltransferase complex dimerization subunit type 1 TsaB [Candidatus Saccharibacteria bacterium]